MYRLFTQLNAHIFIVSHIQNTFPRRRYHASSGKEEASKGAHMKKHIVVLDPKCDEFNNFEGF